MRTHIIRPATDNTTDRRRARCWRSARGGSWRTMRQNGRGRRAAREATAISVSSGPEQHHRQPEEDNQRPDASEESGLAIGRPSERNSARDRVRPEEGARGEDDQLGTAMRLQQEALQRVLAMGLFFEELGRLKASLKEQLTAYLRRVTEGDADGSEAREQLMEEAMRNAHATIIGGVAVMAQAAILEVLDEIPAIARSDQP